MSERPALLALVTDAFGGRGGIAQYNRDFLVAAADSGSVSAILALPRNAPADGERPARATIMQTGARRWRSTYALAAAKAALLMRPRIVFCGHLYMAPLAATVSRLVGARLVVQAHGIDAWRRPTPLQRAAAEAADLVLCVSRHTRNSVLSWARNSPERVIVLPPTVADEFTPGNGASVRRELDIENARVLLTVGRLDSRERYKGHDRVIQALGVLPRGGTPTVYLIAGDGDDRPRLEALSHALGTESRVRFLGEVGRDRLVDLYRAADLFVMPSTGEGFGIAFIEAMACGTQALGLDAGGARDALADGDLGGLAHEENLGARIATALARPVDRRRLAIATRGRFGRDGFNAGVRDVISRLDLAA
jgi:phosphatidylinositol alpha-1,6-mannosyltransferase